MEYFQYTQWKGHLKKIRLNTNGSFGATQWDAADRLNKKSYTSRNLWTAGISTVSTNNFTTTNRDELKKLTGNIEQSVQGIARQNKKLADFFGENFERKMIVT